MKDYPQVMTIVRNSPTDEPIIVSSNIPGNVSFRENEVEFLRKMLACLEDISKGLRKKADQYRENSNS